MRVGDSPQNEERTMRLAKQAAVVFHHRLKPRPSVRAAGQRSALDHLLKKHEGLIKRLAVLVIRSCQKNGTFSNYLELTDLDQQGRLALIDAVRCFEPASGQKFTTYFTRAAFRRMSKFAAHRRNRATGGQEISEPEESEADRRALGRLTNQHELSYLDTVGDLLRRLDEPYAMVVRLKAGVLGEPALEWSEIGARLGLPGWKVKMIHARGMESLRQFVELCPV